MESLERESIPFTLANKRPRLDGFVAHKEVSEEGEIDDGVSSDDEVELVLSPEEERFIKKDFARVVTLINTLMIDRETLHAGIHVTSSNRFYFIFKIPLLFFFSF